VRSLRLGPHDRQLLLRRLAKVDFVDSDQLREITDLGLAITRDNHDALEVMFRREMLHERRTICSRLVAETACDWNGVVDNCDALHAVGLRRKLIDELRGLLGELASA